MDGRQLKKALRLVLANTGIINFHVTSKNCLKFLKFDCAETTIVICNTSSTYPGEHWVVFYVRNINGRLVAEYFDSFARSVNTYGLSVPFHITSSNTQILQSNDSLTCGMHCLFYVYYKARNYPIKYILSMYKSSQSVNDRIVNSFYCKLIRKC
jgi:hypothetical protein